MAEHLALHDLHELEDQEAIRDLLAALHRAGEDNVAALRAWRSHLGPEPWHYRVHDALQSTERTVHEIERFIAERYFY